MAILDEIRTHLLRTQKVHHASDTKEDAGRAQRRSELLDPISLLVKQHEEVLLQQVEADLREKALAAVKQESELLRQQVYERVVSADSELQRVVERILSDVRRQVFQRVGKEVSTILEGLDTRLLEALGVPLPEPALTLPATSPETSALPEPVLEPQLEKQDAKTDAECEQLYQHEVCIAIMPPFKLPTLMEFYKCLWEMHNLNTVQTCGSVDKGITLELRLTEPKPLQQVMKSIPYVESVRDSSSPSSGDGRRTICVTLKPPTDAVISHEQA